ncbi:MAG: 4-hydroxy-3-methylbut-2-enyl diphosphate reductase [Mycoplasmatales bacterium]
MNVIKITPRGFCHGVVNSIKITKEIAIDPTVTKPLYMLGMLVHNKNIVHEIEQLGVTIINGQSRLEMIKKITEGTIIITAHGTDKRIFEIAKQKNLTVIDTTCREVYQTHDLVKSRIADGYDVLYISKAGHPEQEGVRGVSEHNLHMIESYESIADLDLNNSKICVTNQTTMNMFFVDELVEKILEKYPHALVENELCSATRLRQDAIVNEAKKCDFVYVVGDTLSNNSNKLVEIAIQQGAKAKLIENIQDIQLADLRGHNTIGVTSGASTPSQITNLLIRYLEQLELDDPATHDYQPFIAKKII